MENKKPHNTSCLLLIAKLTVSLGNTLNLILLLDGIAAQQHKLSRPFMLTISVIETIPGVPNATSTKACTAAPVRYSSIYNFAAVQFCTLPALLLVVHIYTIATAEHLISHILCKLVLQTCRNYRC